MWVINLVLMYYLFRINVSGILDNSRKKKDFVSMFKAKQRLSFLCNSNNNS